MPVPEPISGLAFFPGGFGLWGSAAGQPLPPFPVGGVMVLGHDFHSETGYHASLKHGCESEKMPTWLNLLKLLGNVGIARESCFFTNLYMGLRAGNATTGVFPGAYDKSFVVHCTSFLLDQLRAQRPALILTLGVHVPPVIGKLSAQLAPWAKGRGLRHLDTVGPVRDNVTFDGIEDYATTAVALIHPSLRHASLRYREYGGERGHAAETLMLNEALRLAGLTSVNEHVQAAT